MTIAISYNPSSIGSLMTTELNKRGIETTLYAPHAPITDNTGVNVTLNPRKLRTLARFYLHRRLFHYDLEVENITGSPSLRIRADQQLPIYHGMELEKGYVKPRRGFYTTPNLAPHTVAGSQLLPRPVNLEMFTEPKTRRQSETIQVGHFWRRGNITSDYAFRYFKGSDVVDQAVAILKREGYDVQLVDSLVFRDMMPYVLSQLDVLAEQFRVGSYGLPAVEALLVGTPVVGHYVKELCECPEAFDLFYKAQTPQQVADMILQARDDSGHAYSARPVREYHSPKHTVDVFLDYCSKWGLQV